jgi:hypothetical protein
MRGAHSHINITGTGELRHFGNVVTGFQNFVNAGKITAYDQADMVEIEYIQDGNYTRVTAIPEPASMFVFGLGSILFVRSRRK